MTNIGQVAVLCLGIYCLYQWWKLIGGMINGHRQSNQALHGNSDSPADHGAGAIVASATYPPAIPAGALPSRPGPGKGGAYITRNTVTLPAHMVKGLTATQQIALAKAVYAQQKAQALAGAPITSLYPGPIVSPIELKPIEHGGMKLGEIIGYRVWRIVDGGYLKSCSAETVWAPGETIEGDIGNDGHGLGVHAWKSKSLMLQYGGYHKDRCAIGSIRMWGEIVEHDRGYRSQYASILSIDDVIASGFPVNTCADALVYIRQKYGLS